MESCVYSVQLVKPWNNHDSWINMPGDASVECAEIVFHIDPSIRGDGVYSKALSCTLS